MLMKLAKVVNDEKIKYEKAQIYDSYCQQFLECNDVQRKMTIIEEVSYSIGPLIPCTAKVLALLKSKLMY